MTLLTQQSDSTLINTLAEYRAAKNVVEDLLQQMRNVMLKLDNNETCGLQKHGRVNFKHSQ